MLEEVFIVAILRHTLTQLIWNSKVDDSWRRTFPLRFKLAPSLSGTISSGSPGGGVPVVEDYPRARSRGSV